MLSNGLLKKDCGMMLHVKSQLFLSKLFILILFNNRRTDHDRPKEFPGFRDDYLQIIEECKNYSG